MIETENIEREAQRSLNRILPRGRNAKIGHRKRSPCLDAILLAVAYMFFLSSARYVWICTVIVTISLIWKI